MLRIIITFLLSFFMFSHSGAYILEFKNEKGEKKYYHYEGYELATDDGKNFYTISQYEPLWYDDSLEEKEIVLLIEDGKYYIWGEYAGYFDGQKFVDKNGDILYTFDGKNYYEGNKQTDLTRIFITEEWENSTLEKQQKMDEKRRNSVYSHSFLFDFYDTGETHPEYGKKYYTDFEPLYSKDGEHFYTGYGRLEATKKDGIYTFLGAGDEYRFDDKNFSHAIEKMPYSWDGKNYYKFWKKLYFQNDMVYNYEPSLRLGYIDETRDELLWKGKQIGIETGTVIFPENISLQRLQKTKQIHIKWFPQEQETDIPQYDTFLETYLKLAGTTVQDIVGKQDDSGQPLLQIAGMAYRCQDTYEWIGDGFEVERNEKELWTCLENTLKLQANTQNSQNFLVHSDTKQTVKFRIYPVHPEKYVFHSKNSWNILPKLLVFDPVMEYYNISALNISNGEYSETILKKKYDVQKKEFFYAERQSDGGVFSRGEQIILYPYYEGEVTLEKWENNFSFSYETFTPIFSGVVYMVEE